MIGPVSRRFASVGVCPPTQHAQIVRCLAGSLGSHECQVARASKAKRAVVETFFECAAWAESNKYAKYDNLCAAAGTTFQPFALETTGGHGASTNAVYYLFTKHLRESGVPGEALKRILRAAEEELAVNEVGLAM